VKTCWTLVLVLIGCTKTVGLDLPLRYAAPKGLERLSVACLYAIDPQLDSRVLVNYPVRVELGPAVQGQLRTVLAQLCGASTRVADRAEFLELAAQRPALLFSVSAAVTLAASRLNSSTSSGSVSGEVLVTGPSDAAGLRYRLEGRGSFANDAYQAVDGAEGFRDALRRAFQGLLDQAAADRERLVALAQPSAPQP
jgi:hypothetical protein